ncbi:MAG: N-terminal phage integrase SAM-like domain-containing protein, partial [Pseudomonadota bacterium]
MSDLCERFLDEHARHHKRPSSVANDALNIKNHILPLIGPVPVRQITRRDVERLKQDVRDGRTATRRKMQSRTRRSPNATGGPGAANHTLSLLLKMFNLAEIWGWRDENSNPVRLVARYKSHACERYLSDPEIERLFDTLDAYERLEGNSPQAANAL